MATDVDIGGSNSNAESIPRKGRYGEWIVENEKIFKGCKEPVADNSFNNGGEKVDTQIPESQAISATPGNLLKQPGRKNGENNVKYCDSYRPQEKVRSSVQQAFFERGWDSAQTAGVPNEAKDSRENQGRSRSKTRKSSSSSSDNTESEASSSSAHLIQKERNVRNQRKRKLERTKRN